MSPRRTPACGHMPASRISPLDPLRPQACTYRENPLALDAARRMARENVSYVTPSPGIAVAETIPLRFEHAARGYPSRRAVGEAL